MPLHFQGLGLVMSVMLCLSVSTTVSYSWYCIPADPFLNGQNFILSVLSLEELGATGNKVCRCFTAAILSAALLS